ncbi:uncharacterized protein LOC127291654 [Leptopilina boulardi]|uniref:uncharacterized protein LOC127291654 n=1 Tax=Leptopilina boulardi TaxID=63433 RepID=UPI0021F5610D|nr:uncharacterized protein LOC127291654 [Leptopilina boulardi]
MVVILSIAIVCLSFSLGESLICYTCASPGSEFSDRFDKCQNVFSSEASYFPFENNPKCYNGAFCAKFILDVSNRKVEIRQCISQFEIVKFDLQNPPSPTETIKINYMGYTADAYFCDKNYCNGASIMNISVIAFLLPLFLYTLILNNLEML